LFALFFKKQIFKKIKKMNSDILDLNGFVNEANAVNGMNGHSYDKNNNTTGHSHSKHHYNLNAITNTYILFFSNKLSPY